MPPPTYFNAKVVSMMPEGITTIDVNWFVYGLAVAGRYNSITVDNLEEFVDYKEFGELLLGTESSSGGDSA